MKRVSNSRNIGDIEFIVDTLSVGDAKRVWNAHGVECKRDRHRFSGQTYDFMIEALELRMVRSGRVCWQVLIVTEWWRSTDTDAEIRSTKWLKVLRGKPTDVTAWMRRCRTLKEEKSMTSAASGLATSLADEERTADG
jgi:hypothetical protein